MKYTIEELQGLAAQAWCTEKNENKEMDSDLACAFADIMFEYEKEVEGITLYKVLDGEIIDGVPHESGDVILESQEFSEKAGNEVLDNNTWFKTKEQAIDAEIGDERELAKQ